MIILQHSGLLHNESNGCLFMKDILEWCRSHPGVWGPMLGVLLLSISKMKEPENKYLRFLWRLVVTYLTFMPWDRWFGPLKPPGKAVPEIELVVSKRGEEL